MTGCLRVCFGDDARLANNATVKCHLSLKALIGFQSQRNKTNSSYELQARIRQSSLRPGGNERVERQMNVDAH